MDRFAPIAAAIAIAVAFVLSLVVAVSAVSTAEMLMARAPAQKIEKIEKVKAPAVLVKCDATNPGRCG